MTRALTTLLAALVLALAACGGGREAQPLPETVEGTIAQPTAVEGDADAGKELFAQNGCGGCHTYGPADATGTVGPNLEELAADAGRTNEPLDEYVRTSIVSPSSYLVPNYPDAMPSYSSLSQKQVADLVAFLTQEQ